jgi:hypothetical protein
MKIYILAQGKGSRWEGENLPSEYKQLVPMGNGELLVHRTIRQIRETLGGYITVDVNLIAPGDFLLYAINENIDFRSFREPIGCILEGICRTKKEWEGHRIVFLLGDVVYSNYAIRHIVNARHRLAFFGRKSGNPITGKEAREIFALGFNDDKLVQYCIWDRMREIYFRQENKDAKLWTFYDYLTNKKTWDSVVKGSAFHVINDYTDDIDSPEEYNLFYEKLKELALADDERRI